MKTISGNLDAAGLKIVIVKTRANSMLTDQLLKGAAETFERHGGSTEDLTVIDVPTISNINVILRQVLSYGIASAVVCLAAEFESAENIEYVKSLSEQAAMFSIPVSNGIVLGNAFEDMVNECGVKAGNKGETAMNNAIETVNLLKNSLSSLEGE